MFDFLSTLLLQKLKNNDVEHVMMQSIIMLYYMKPEDDKCRV